MENFIFCAVRHAQMYQKYSEITYLQYNNYLILDLNEEYSESVSLA